MTDANKLLNVALLFLSLTTAAQSQTATASHPDDPGRPWKLEAIGLMNIGSTVYELNALAPDPRGGGAVVPIRSRLEFPLDVASAGGRLSWRPNQGALQRWEFSLSGLMNLNDPSSKMINSDYVDGAEVIHTESDAQLDYVSGSAEIQYRLTTGGGTSLNLVLRTAYDRIEALMVDYEGWQASLFTGAKYDISGTGPVLKYRVSYVSPQAGVELSHRLAGGIRINLNASGGMVFASDFDEHLLRGRTSEGTGTGVGLNSNAGIELLPGSLPVDRLSLALFGRVTYYHAEGEMDQTFDGGMQYLGIPYMFESLRGELGISMGYDF